MNHTRLSSIMDTIQRQFPVPTERVENDKGIHLVTKDAGPDGRYSIWWDNYPLNKFLSLKLRSHYDLPPGGGHHPKVYTAHSVRELILLAQLLFTSSDAISSLEGEALVAYILERTKDDLQPGQTEGEQQKLALSHLLGDVIEYCDSHGLDFQQLVEESKSLFDC